MEAVQEQIGVENLQKAVVGFAMLGSGIDKATKNGLDFDDAGHLLPPLLQLIPALAGAGQIPKEIGDLDESEKMQIQQAVAAATNLVDKKLEAVVEKAFNAVLSLVEVYLEFGKL